MRPSAPLSPADAGAVFIATLGPIGRMPKAPGTWGSLAATCAAPWLFSPLPLAARLAVLALVLLGGAWAAGRAEFVYPSPESKVSAPRRSVGDRKEL